MPPLELYEAPSSAVTALPETILATQASSAPILAALEQSTPTPQAVLPLNVLTSSVSETLESGAVSLLPPP